MRIISHLIKKRMLSWSKEDGWSNNSFPVRDFACFLGEGEHICVLILYRLNFCFLSRAFICYSYILKKCPLSMERNHELLPRRLTRFIVGLCLVPWILLVLRLCFLSMGCSFCLECSSLPDHPDGAIEALLGRPPLSLVASPKLNHSLSPAANLCICFPS